MKKAAAFLLALCFLAFTACGTAENEQTQPGAQDSGVTQGTNAQGQTQAQGNDEQQSTPTSGGSSGVGRSVAYFTSWSAYARAVTVGDMDPSLLTHVNFAFANLNSDGEIVIGDSWVDVEKPFGDESWEAPNDSRGHFSQLRQMKQKYPHIRTLISVGGWTWSKNFSDVAATPEGRDKFAKSAAAFVSKYGFDGLDVDWEFPVEGGDNITHRPDDKENYTKLMARTREELNAQGAADGKQYLLTIAGGPNVTFTKNTQLKEMMQYLDFINVMAYDYHGAWESVTNHNAPLYSNPNDPTPDASYSVEGTIDAYINAGVAPQDLNLGLAFYGRGWINVDSKTNNGLWQNGTAPTSVGFGQGTWEGACFDYWDLKENYIGKGGYVRYFDEAAKVPYLYNGSSFISYDDEESIRAKLEFAKQKNLGGAMFWEFSGDKHMELQKIIAEFYSINGAAVQPQETPSQDTQQSGGDTSGTVTPPEQSGGAAAWDAGTVYTGGEIVSYNGKKYRAKWWTQGETPNDSDQYGVWEPVN